MQALLLEFDFVGVLEGEPFSHFLLDDFEVVALVWGDEGDGLAGCFCPACAADAVDVVFW